MALANAFHGQCRLWVDTTSQISLQRQYGAWLPVKIGSTWQASLIPPGGLTLSNSGLVAATLYYIYAFDNAGTLTLEASTTGRTTDAATGVEINDSFATRTLVGMVFTDAGSPGTFVDSTAKRWCLNWFNRRSLSLTNTFSADRTTTGTSFAELNTEIRMQFLTWADEAVSLSASGTAMNSSASQAAASAIAIDSTTVATQATSVTTPTSTRLPIALWVSQTLAEGSHFATLLGAVSAGTGTWHTADNVSTGTAKTRLWGTVRG